METRQTRIEMLSRIGRGRKELPSLAAALSRILGLSLSTAQFIPLPETDKLWEIYGKGYSESRLGATGTYRRFFKSDEWKTLPDLTRCVTEGLHNDEAFLLLGQSKTCGAVPASASTLLSHFEKLINLDGDGLRLLAGDLAQGLMIDRNPDDPVWFVEVAVWGGAVVATLRLVFSRSSGLDTSSCELSKKARSTRTVRLSIWRGH